MNKQHGGAVDTRILVALIVAALASAVMNIYLSRHYTTQGIAPCSLAPVGIFPREADSCGSPRAICYLKI